MKIPKQVALLLVLISISPALAASDDFYKGDGGSVITPRHAFVIGVGNYQYLTPLRNPSNDATAFGDKLRSLGFDSPVLSTEKTDPRSTTRNAILDGLNDLSDQTKADGGVMVFYFAGHGLSFNGQTYIVPSDARITKAEDLEIRAIPISIIYKAVENASPTAAIVIIDACRDKPFGANPLPTGMSTLPVYTDAPYRSISFFSTVLGLTADDGAGKNSQFTAALVKFMSLHVPISEVFNDVRQTFDGPDIVKAPVAYDRLSGKFQLLVTQGDFDAEQKKFADFDARGHSDDYRGFLGAYPGGYFERIARQKYLEALQMERIDRTSRAVTPTPQSPVTTQPDTVILSDPAMGSSSTPLRNQEVVVKIGEIANFLEVLRSDGSRGFVGKGAVNGAARIAGAHGSIGFDAQTGNTGAADLAAKISDFVRAVPSRGVVTVQATLPESSSSANVPAALDTSLRAAKALENAGIATERIRVSPVARSGATASIDVLSVAE